MIRPITAQDREVFLSLSEQFYSSPAVLHAVPRAVQGSSAHVPIPDDVRFLQEQAYNITRSDETGDADESQTVAIPKHVLDGVDRKPLRGTAEADGAQTEAGPQVADGSQSQGTDDNPRSRWR